MTTKPGQFRQLMQQVREGSEEAARQLFEEYGPHILRVVRRKLSKKLRSKFDSLDFAQDVWKSFFAEPSEQRHFDQPEELIAFLVHMAQNKVVDAYRQRSRNLKQKREHSLDSASISPDKDLVGHQPTPSHLLSAKEQWSRFLRDQPDRTKKILLLLRQGKTHKEIAQRLDIDEKTVRRVLHRLSLETQP